MKKKKIIYRGIWRKELDQGQWAFELSTLQLEQILY